MDVIVTKLCWWGWARGSGGARDDEMTITESFVPLMANPLTCCSVRNVLNAKMYVVGAKNQFFFKGQKW